MTSSTSLIARARMFEWYARNAWNVHRNFVRRHLHRRCRNCVVSEAYSPLDDTGLCKLCETYIPSSDSDTPDPAVENLATSLDRLFRDHEGKGEGLFDAAVMLSGGKDSAFLIHELQRRYPALRIVALTIDNSYMSPVALDNARLSVAKLDVDHITLRLPESVYRKSFKFACTIVEPGEGCFETVDRIDADLGFSQAKIFAAQNRIPLLLSGLSWAQIELLFAVKSFEVPQDQAFAKIEGTLGHRLDEIYAADEMQYWWDPARFPRETWPRFIHPFYVWRHGEEEIKARVTELGLIEPGNESPLLTNNQIIPLMIVVDYLRLGYASFEPEFAQLVREGKASPGFWRNVFEMLEYSARTGWMLDKELDKIVRSIDLTREQVGLVRS
jgi:hypothetical protein